MNLNKLAHFFIHSYISTKSDSCNKEYEKRKLDSINKIKFYCGGYVGVGAVGGGVGIVG